MEWELNTMCRADWEQVRSVFLEGIATANATFETDAPSWEQWDSSHLPDCRLVARRPDERIVGWAALSRISHRRVYCGVAEVSVYVGVDSRGHGVGAALLDRMIGESEAAGIWTLQAHIFPENEASLQLHRRAGFRDVGRRERLGEMRGRWRDVVLLERRSRIVGI